MVYQIKSYMNPEDFDKSFIMNSLSWLAFISFGLIFIGCSACFVLFGVWFMVAQSSSSVGAEVFEVFLKAVLVTIFLVIPFKIFTVAYEDLSMPESCMPVKIHSRKRLRNEHGFYYVT